MHALMVVDLQAEFNVPASVVDKIRARADTAATRIFTQFFNPPGSLFRRKLDATMCTPGTPGTALVIQPRSNDLLIQKQTYGLKQEHIGQIRAHGVTRVTVSGVDTDACVLAVMFSLWDSGIDCQLDPDLCWSSSGLHAEAVKIAQQQFGS